MLVAKRPFAIFRVGSGDSLIAPAGTADSGGAPGKGWDSIDVYMRLPAGGGTLAIQQKLRDASTYQATDSFVLAAAGFISTIVPRTAELVRVVFTNGGVGQRPEIIVTLV